MHFAQPPNGLELSCPAEAGNRTWTLGHDGWQDKNHQMPSPPGQLQREAVRKPRAKIIGGTKTRYGCPFRVSQPIFPTKLGV
jgi:hypothetical protein